MAGFLTWLLAYRVLYRRNGEVTPLHLVLPAAGAAAATAIGEATIYFFTSGVDARRILLAHFDFDLEVRPAWGVPAASLAVAAVAFGPQKPARQQPSARRLSPPALPRTAPLHSLSSSLTPVPS